MRKLSIIYDMTSACPWDCRICCVSAKKDRDEDELSLLEKEMVINAIIEFSKKRPVRCDVSGGELFTDIRHLEMLRKLSEGIGKENVGISISGAYLSEEIAEELSDIVSDVELTLDCPPDMEYPIRPCGYHKIAAKAAIMLKEKNVKVGIQTVLTKDNCNLKMMEGQLEWMCNNHIDDWSFIKFFPVGKGCDCPEKGITEKEWLWYQNNLEKRVALLGLDAPKLDYHYLLPNHAKHSEECRCVKRSIGILPNGVVTSCFWGLDNKRNPLDSRFVLGKVPGESLVSIMESKKAKYWESQPHKCCLLQEGCTNEILFA